MTKEPTVLPDDWPTPAEIIGELLRTHPEAESLLAEASHCRALAVRSADDAGLKFQAAQAARLSYEELRHRLAPRRGRPVHFDLGLLFLAVLSAGIALLDLSELSGAFGVPGAVPLALAATAVWVTIAWLAAVAARRRRWSLFSVLAAMAAALALLLTALHGSAGVADWWPASGRPGGSAVFGPLAAALILVLVAGAAVLVVHLEPASVLAARRRWHRARASHAEAVQIRQADLEAAAVAGEAWLSLVRAWAAMTVPGGEQVIGETVTLASALLESARPQLSPAG